MALLVDGLVSEASDLMAYESDVKEIAAGEGVDLLAKAKLAQVEVAAQIEASSRRPGHVFFAQGSGWQSVGSDAALPRFDTGQVVVTPPLKMWHTFQTLALVYRDANSSKVRDKYVTKWREYKELSKWAQELLYQTGVGLVTQPLPRPESPSVELVDSTLVGMSVALRTTWVAANGEESAGSVVRAIKTPEGKTLLVTVSAPPSAAVGWNVYAGEDGAELERQNPAPLDLTSSWTLPGTGLAEGETIGVGQAPEAYRTVPRFLQRG